MTHPSTPPSAVVSSAEGSAASLALTPEQTEVAGSKPLARGLLVLCIVLAFRGALWAKEAMLGLAVHAAQCPGAGLSFKPGGGGLHVHGLEGCQAGGALGAGLVGAFASALIAVPILVATMRGRGRPFNQLVATTGYLFGLASAVEVLSATLVFPPLGRFEAAAVRAGGLNPFLLMPVGLAFGYAFWWLGMQTSARFVVDFLGWPEDKVPPFKKAVLFKLSAGTLLVSALRLSVG